MRVLCDADVDRPLVEALRAAGHDVSSVAEIQADSPDERVLDLANSLGAILITRDKDFGHLVYRQELANHGVLLLRLAGVPLSQRISLLVKAMTDYGSELSGSFSVLSKGGLRIRRSHA